MTSVNSLKIRKFWENKQMEIRINENFQRIQNMELETFLKAQHWLVEVELALPLASSSSTSPQTLVTNTSNTTTTTTTTTTNESKNNDIRNNSNHWGWVSQLEIKQETIFKGECCFYFYNKNNQSNSNSNNNNNNNNNEVNCDEALRKESLIMFESEQDCSQMSFELCLLIHPNLFQHLPPFTTSPVRMFCCNQFVGVLGES